MRPFKLFFGLSLGFILLIFFARFFFMAFIVAAILSGLFFVFRRIKYFMYQTDRAYNYENRWDDQRALPEWKEDEIPFFDINEQRQERVNNFRSIKIQ